MKFWELLYFCRQINGIKSDALHFGNNSVEVQKTKNFIPKVALCVQFFGECPLP